MNYFDIDPRFRFPVLEERRLQELSPVDSPLISTLQQLYLSSEPKATKQQRGEYIYLVFAFKTHVYLALRHISTQQWVSICCEVRIKEIEKYILQHLHLPYDRWELATIKDLPQWALNSAGWSGLP